MKTTVTSSICIALLAGCVATPPTPLSAKDLEYAVYWQKVAQVCIQRGQINYLPATTSYIGIMGNAIATRATAEQVKVASQNVFAEFPLSRVGIAACRYVESDAVQVAQQRADQQRKADIRRQERAVDDLVRAQDNTGWPATQQSAFNSRPVTCTHYQWGNTTFCN